MERRIRTVRLLLLPVIVLAVFTHHIYPEDSVWDTGLTVAGFVFLIVAMAGRIWTTIYIAGKKNRVLVTAGPYAVVRNPLYLFTLVGFLGAGFAFESLTLGAALTAVFFVTHWPAILTEERRLRALFGEEYESYRARVPRILPSVSAVSSRVRRSRSLEVDAYRLENALRDCLLFPLVFVLAEILEWGKISGIIPVLIYLP